MIDLNNGKFIEVPSLFDNNVIERHICHVWEYSTIDEQYAVFVFSNVVHNKTCVDPTFLVPSRLMFYKN